MTEILALQFAQCNLEIRYRYVRIIYGINIAHMCPNYASACTDVLN